MSCGVLRFSLALLLLMLRIFADDHHATLALNDLALFTDGFYGRSDFHDAASLPIPIYQFLLLHVIRPRDRSYGESSIVTLSPG